MADVEALKAYWDICPTLKTALFNGSAGFQPAQSGQDGRVPGYLDLAVDKSAIKRAIYDHPEFAAFIEGMNTHFAAWRAQAAKILKALKPGIHPKEVIAALSEGLLAHYTDKPLIDKYDVYQHLMDYWAQTMQDDCYLTAQEGWKAETYRVIETDKKGKEKDKGWACDLVPKPLIVARYYAKEQEALDRLTAELESVAAKLAELEEDPGNAGFQPASSDDTNPFAELDKVNKANVAARLKEIKDEMRARASSPSEHEACGQDGRAPASDEAAVLNAWLKLNTDEADLKKRLKDAEADLDSKAYAHYPKLTEAEIKALAVDDKWLAALDRDIHSEMDRISQALTQRVKDLAERYETPLPQLTGRVAVLEARVNRHLEKMGFAWK